MKFKQAVTLALALVSVGLAAPSAAQACSVGDSGVTRNQVGDAAKFERLRAKQGMNCPSARYVMNNWLRPTFRKSYSRRLPRRFYDGYVTWYCGKTSYLRWRCDEFDSDTAFTFKAYIL